MAEFTVFYSWQSDLPRKLTRDVVHDAAAAAIARLRLDADLEDSPRLDHDTEGASGTPEIAATIFSKIRSAGIVVADVSMIGATTSEDPNKARKLIPNPNVLLELGYAAGKIGWERIVLVMNEAYGEVSQLPFDLRNRRFPITFNLSDRQRIAEKQASLAGELENAIRSSLQHEHSTVDAIIESLDLHSIAFIRQFGNAEAMVIDPRKSMEEILGSLHLDASIKTLLEKGVLKCVFDHGRQDYVCIWTYLGKLLLKKFGISHRSQKSPVNPAELSFTIDTCLPPGPGLK